MPENLALKEVHSSEETITDFDTLIRRVPDMRDKVLCAAIATFADIGLAEQFISHLVNLPAPVDHNRIMHGIKVSSVLGLSTEQAQRAFNLSAAQVQDIHDYLGLNNNSNQVSKAYLAGIRN